MYFSPNTCIKKKNAENTELQHGRGLHYIKGWTLPKLHDKKKWYIDFSCIDPSLGRMRRKRYYIPDNNNTCERYLQASKIITDLTSKLQKGWNPWTSRTVVAAENISYKTVSERYSRYAEQMFRLDQIRRWTYLDWISYHKNFDRWFCRNCTDIEAARDINLSVVTSFLDYLLDKGVTAHTRNNYRSWLFQYCEWMIERGFMDDNPVKQTKKLRVGPKFREAFSESELQELKDYLLPRNPYFYFACLMEYYCFVRPIELVQVRIEYIDMEKQQLFIPGTIAKNRLDYMVGLNDTLADLINELGILECPGDWYLFGKDFKPSPRMADSRIFRDYFFEIRKILQWPMTKQFYSLKDSGIRDLANAEGIVIARDQARHTDISTTNRYLKGSALAVHEETKHFKGEL